MQDKVAPELTGLGAAVDRAMAIDQLRGRSTCSVKEAARVLGIGRSTAYAAVRDGSLPIVRISHRLLVPTARLFDLLGVEAPRSCSEDGSSRLSGVGGPP